MSLAISACDGKSAPEPAESAENTAVATSSASSDDAGEVAQEVPAEDEFSSLAPAAEQLVRRARKSDLCDVDIYAKDDVEFEVLAPRMMWAGDAERGIVRGGVYCPPAEPPPCKAVLETVKLDGHAAFIESLYGLCGDDWTCTEWECSMDVMDGMKAIVRFAPGGEGAVVAGSFQTPMKSGDDGKIDVAAHRAKWEATVADTFRAQAD